MTTPTLAPLHVPDRRIPLPDRSVLTITGTVPTSATDIRTAVRGSQLYLIAGRLNQPGAHLAGYLGMSSVLHGARAATSFTRWVRDLARINVCALALLHRDHDPYHPDALAFAESRIISRLSAPGNVAMVNTHSSANMATARLTRAEVLAAQDLADALIDLIHEHVYLGLRNGPDAPCPNARERAVRQILMADRAIDTEELVHRLAAAGHHTTAQRPEYVSRRDVVQREATRGTPRVFSTAHRGRRVYWGSTHCLTKRQALAGYDRAHPIRRNTPANPAATPTPPTHPVPPQHAPVPNRPPRPAPPHTTPTPTSGTPHQPPPPDTGSATTSPSGNPA